MTSINFSSLNASQCLVACADRMVQKRPAFVWLIDKNQQDWPQNVARAIQNFLQANSALCPTFKAQDNLHQELAQTSYLVVYVTAVSLTKTYRLPDTAPIDFRDLFSLGMVAEPVQCERGHTFEKGRLIEWMKSRGDVCPLGEHVIGAIVVDDDLKERIGAFTQSQIDHQSKMEKIQGAVDQAVEQAHQANAEAAEARKTASSAIAITGAMQQQLSSIEKRVFPKAMCMAGGGIKVASRAALAGFVGVTTATTSVSAWSKLGMHGAKIVPVVSCVAGVVLFCYRLYLEQHERAAVELVSGVVGCFPGAGTFVGIGLDALLMFLDGLDLWNMGKQDIDREQALQILGFEKGQSPHKAEIEARYKEYSRDNHPDKEPDVEAKHIRENIQKMINRARDVLLNSAPEAISV